MLRLSKGSAVVLILVLLASGNLFAQHSSEHGTTWLTDFETAKKVANEEGKTILMSFSGSDWCGNCMRLDKTLFQTEDFANYADENLVLLLLDFPSKRKNALPEEQLKHNEALAKVYNPKGTFPTVVLLNGAGDKKGKLTFPASTPADYIKEMNTIIN